MDRVDKYEKQLLQNNNISNAIGLVESNVQTVLKEARKADEKMARLTKLLDDLRKSKIYLPDETREMSGIVMYLQKIAEGKSPSQEIVNNEFDVDYLCKALDSERESLKTDVKNEDVSDVYLAVVDIKNMAYAYTHEAEKEIRPFIGGGDVAYVILNAVSAIDKNGRYGPNQNELDLIMEAISTPDECLNRNIYEDYKKIYEQKYAKNYQQSNVQKGE